MIARKSKLIEQVFELSEIWFSQNFLGSELYSKIKTYTRISPELQLESFFSYLPREKKALEKLNKALAKAWFYQNKRKNIRNLFISASTVPVTPLVEIIFSILLDRKITCRISNRFSLELYQFFKKKAPKELQDYFEFVTWDSSDLEKTKSFLEQADFITVHGNNKTIRKIQELKNSKQRLIAFGNKFSFIIFDLDFLDQFSCKLIAKDICLYRQLGCLSPQVIYLISTGSVKQEKFFSKFVEKLDLEIKKFEQYFSDQDLLQKQAFRQNLFLSLFNKIEFLTENIILAKDLDFNYSPGLGLVFVKKLKSFEQITEVRNRLSNISFLSTIGTNFQEESFAFRKLKSLFTTARISPIGEMQRPGLNWIQNPSLVLA